MRHWWILCLLALLSACASKEALFRPTAGQQSSVDSPFSVSGRLAVDMAGRGHTANFEWTHSVASDELSVNTPVGTTVARLQRDAAGVTLQADGKTWQAPDVESLTQARLGWPLPLGNLVWWIRGRPAPGETEAYDAEGNLLQQGWRIRFLSDPDAASPYPKRVDLSRDDLTIRLVTYRWQ
ncbi:MULTISPECIES: lipoprotein insertase outer membrane protein LolB [unclassified Paludibacterium]|uniref:lipoprotein insertase outer membrane protein LolB n=1 Tax=unclassified Paludibacterium TaxID=2618429 RepID=UPI001C042985|nr:lipoprotein insertase outer membrane protein LolB [Paludibacterium sp. B53371]BEV73277.1 lipoprotein insertase outer membrane protein LolB [Paludibacterium sp. THUN1379]